MRDNSRGTGDEMTVTAAIQDARGWSEFLLSKAFRGPGDTIERAAHEVEATHGVPASIILRLRHRRDIGDMLLSNWLTLKHGYEAAVEATRRQADHQRFLAEQAGANATNSRSFAVAALLDRPQGSRSAERLNGPPDD